MKRIEIAVEGMTPLLTHNPIGMTAGNGPAPPSKGKQDFGTPEEQAAVGVYRSTEGFCCIPALAFRSCLIAAAAVYKVPKQRSSYQSRVTHIMAFPELTPILDAEGDPYQTFAVDARRVMVQKNGVIRCRPRFEPWAAKFVFELDEGLADPEAVVTMLADGGNRVGVGDYRPQKKGWFGRFTIAGWEEVA